MFSGAFSERATFSPDVPGCERTHEPCKTSAFSTELSHNLLLTGELPLTGRGLPGNAQGHQQYSWQCHTGKATWCRFPWAGVPLEP